MTEFGIEYEQFDETVSGTGMKRTTVEFGEDNLTAKFLGYNENAFSVYFGHYKTP